jgi:hypothetical protein
MNADGPIFVEMLGVYQTWATKTSPKQGRQAARREESRTWDARTLWHGRMEMDGWALICDWLLLRLCTT